VNLRRCARILIALSFFISGLAETLSATGLIVEFSPDAGWGLGIHTLAVGGGLQMAGAALLASGKKTRWALGILLCYVSLGSVFGNLPRIFSPDVDGTAIARLLSNMAVIGGLLYWFHGELTPENGAQSTESLAGNSPQAGQSSSHGLPATERRRSAGGPVIRMTGPRRHCRELR